VARLRTSFFSEASSSSLGKLPDGFNTSSDRFSPRLDGFDAHSDKFSTHSDEFLRRESLSKILPQPRSITIIAINRQANDDVLSSSPISKEARSVPTSPLNQKNKEKNIQNPPANGGVGPEATQNAPTNQEVRSAATQNLPTNQKVSDRDDSQNLLGNQTVGQAATRNTPAEQETNTVFHRSCEWITRAYDQLDIENRSDQGTGDRPHYGNGCLREEALNPDVLDQEVERLLLEADKAVEATPTVALEPETETTLYEESPKMVM
jgi:hypothetical protein